MSRIFWDTNIFIYLMEGSIENSKLAQSLLRRMTERQDELMTSTMTLGEIMVKPIRDADQETIKRYETLLSSPGVVVIDFDRRAAKIYSYLRLDRSIQAPDAIQLACAAAAETDLFVTNDARLSQKKVEGIDFIVPLAKVFL